MGHAQRHYYDADSLETAARVFERAYGIDSDAFYEAYLANEVPDRIPRFDAHVWASFVEDVRRLRGAEPDGDPPIAKVQRTFAHA